jgi:hypothetical protein
MTEFYNSIPGVVWAGFVSGLLTVLGIVLINVLKRFMKKADEYWVNTNERLDKTDDSFKEVNKNINIMITESRLHNYRISHLEHRVSVMTGEPIVNYRE